MELAYLENILENSADAIVVIDPAHAARLFKPFFSTETRGTGPGLAITKEIVEAHGGEIRAGSRPKKGTSVFVEIPR